MSATFELSVLNGIFVVCRFEASTPIPAWSLQAAGFITVTRTDDELSIICREEHAPETAGTAERWRALKVHGPFPLEAVGVLAALSQPLAEAKVSLLAVSTHETDYLFVQSKDLAHAVRALRRHGHTVHVD
jgi:hypothetical protein